MPTTSPHRVRRIRLDDDHDDHQEPDLNPRAVIGGNSGVSHVALTDYDASRRNDDRARVRDATGDSLAGELLIGCEQITAFIFGTVTWPLKKRVYRWASTGDLPT